MITAKKEAKQSNFAPFFIKNELIVFGDIKKVNNLSEETKERLDCFKRNQKSEASNFFYLGDREPNHKEPNGKVPL